VVRGLGSLPDLRVLDRLISGRFWIALIAGSLIGIVGMQVWLLKLNTQIGQSMLRASNLQRDNASLQAEISQLSSGDRIEAQGTRLGLVMALSNGYRFLRVGSGDAARASHSIRPASAQTLVSLRAASRGTRRNAAATTTDTASPSPIASGSGSSSDATGTAAGVSATDSSTGQGR
jgi:cell division protein FtsL